MGNRPRFLRATMVFGAGRLPAIYQDWAELVRGFAGCSGFHAAYLLRGCGQAPAAAGLSLFTDRATHDRTLRLSMAALPPAAERPLVRDVVPVSFQLTSFTGELPEGPFTARLLLHREPLAGAPALRRFLARRPAATADTPGATVCAGRILDGGHLYCSLVLTPDATGAGGEDPYQEGSGEKGSWKGASREEGVTRPAGPDGTEDLRDWWCFAAVGTVGNDGHAQRLDTYPGGCLI